MEIRMLKFVKKYVVLDTGTTTLIYNTKQELQLSPTIL